MCLNNIIKKMGVDSYDPEFYNVQKYKGRGFIQRYFNSIIKLSNNPGNEHYNLNNDTCGWYQRKNLYSGEIVLNHYKNGIIDNDDGPGMLTSNGGVYWYQQGRIHREDGPAIISPTGQRLWFQNGVKHRCSGPAVVNLNMVIKFYRDGLEIKDSFMVKALNALELKKKKEA